ncbi:TPA: hypothetical protein SML71_000719 [Serratia marcescens]|nr:hypothetical protein [Serratia marcescens]
MARTYPTEWKKFCRTISTPAGFNYYTQKINKNVSLGDFNRFSARYSLAKDFMGIDIQNATMKTKLGYEALMNALLVWSVVEYYYIIFKTQSNSHYDLLTYNKSELAAIRNKFNAIGLDVDKFYKFIRLHCDSKHALNIDEFLNNRDYNPVRLLSAIRHVFSHGTLTANVSNVKSASVNSIVNILKTCILSKIDDEFSSIVKSHPNYLIA